VLLFDDESGRSTKAGATSSLQLVHTRSTLIHPMAVALSLDPPIGGWGERFSGLWRRGGVLAAVVASD